MARLPLVVMMVAGLVAVTGMRRKATEEVADRLGNESTAVAEDVVATVSALQQAEAAKQMHASGDKEPELMRSIFTGISDLLIEIVDRNWVATIFLAAWCPFYGVRAGNFFSRMTNLLLVAAGVLGALMARFACAVLMVRSSFSSDSTWFQMVVRTAAALVLWVLAGQAFVDYRGASKRELLLQKHVQAGDTDAAMPVAAGRASWRTVLLSTLCAFVVPFLTVFVVALTDQFKRTDMSPSTSWLMPLEEIIGVGIGVLGAVMMGTILERSVGESQFLLLAFFTLGLYALVVTGLDVLHYAFGVHLSA